MGQALGAAAAASRGPLAALWSAESIIHGGCDNNAYMKP